MNAQTKEGGKHESTWGRAAWSKLPMSHGGMEALDPRVGGIYTPPPPRKKLRRQKQNRTRELSLRQNAMKWNEIGVDLIHLCTQIGSARWKVDSVWSTSGREKSCGVHCRHV